MTAERGDVLDRIASWSFAGSYTPNKEGSVLTVELVEHGKHILIGKRDGKCLRCYPTIARN